jgi:hypothetical protein
MVIIYRGIRPRTGLRLVFLAQEAFVEYSGFE